ncbi:MAG: VWA domain-containing protein [Pseudomonadota bacterium]
MTQPQLNQLQSRLNGFSELLRAEGYAVHATSIALAHKVLCSTAIQNQQTLQSSLRALFCQSRKQWEDFEHLFNGYWLPTGADSDNDLPISEQPKQTSGLTSGLGYFSETQAQTAATTPSLESQTETTGGGASDSRVLAQRDFRFVFNPRDMRQIELSIDEISRHARKRTRRRYCYATKGRQVDLRRTCRQSLRHDGWAFDLAYRKPKQSPARFLLLLDVSQSMEVYSYLFLRFARGLSQKFQHSDAFAFHTDLVPIGAEMKEKNTGKLEQKLKNLSSGWLGGTKIAESLYEFNQHYARKAVTRQTIVLIFSDGYDSGTPEFLQQQVLQIKQHCRKLVWVNPLLGRDAGPPSDLPIERGMKLVVPHLDMYASAHSVQALRDLAPAFSY